MFALLDGFRTPKKKGGMLDVSFWSPGGVKPRRQPPKSRSTKMASLVPFTSIWPSGGVQTHGFPHTRGELIVGIDDYDNFPAGIGFLSVVNMCLGLKPVAAYFDPVKKIYYPPNSLSPAGVSRSEIEPRKTKDRTGAFQAMGQVLMTTPIVPISREHRVYLITVLIKKDARLTAGLRSAIVSLEEHVEERNCRWICILVRGHPPVSMTTGHVYRPEHGSYRWKGTAAFVGHLYESDLLHTPHIPWTEKTFVAIGVVEIRDDENTAYEVAKRTSNEVFAANKSLLSTRIVLSGAGSAMLGESVPFSLLQVAPLSTHHQQMGYSTLGHPPDRLEKHLMDVAAWWLDPTEARSARMLNIGRVLVPGAPAEPLQAHRAPSEPEPLRRFAE